MKFYNYWIIIVLIIALLSCIKDNEKSDVTETNQFKKLDLTSDVGFNIDQFHDSKTTHSLLYYFDGGCAFCMGNFLSWLRKWNKLKRSDNLKCIFISSDTDSSTFNYYIESSNIIIPTNSFVFIDKGDLFFQSNPEIDINNSYYLLDSNFKVLSMNDPLTLSPEKNIYLDLKLME